MLFTKIYLQVQFELPPGAEQQQQQNEEFDDADWNDGVD